MNSGRTSWAATEAKAYATEYKKLVGLTVRDVYIAPDNSMVGLVMNGPDGECIAWVQCDPEGNGHGFLAIEPK